jgi:hypothetical protein
MTPPDYLVKGLSVIYLKPFCDVNDLLFKEVLETTGRQKQPVLERKESKMQLLPLPPTLFSSIKVS